MLRATVVGATGAAAGAGLVGSIATETTAETTIDVAGDDATIRNGSVAAVWLDLTVEWSYAVPSGEQPATVTVDALAGASEDGLAAVESVERAEVFLESSGTEELRVDLLGTDAVTGEALIPDGDGETAETTVHVGAQLRLFDENDLVIAADSVTTTATIAVTKSAYDPSEHGSVSATGGLTVEVEQ